MSEPRVSVIITVDSASEQLTRCLRSLAAQTMFDIQVVCVATSETTVGTLQPYQVDDPRIQIVLAFSQSRAAARNLGLSLATGEYVHFMNPNNQLEAFAYSHWWTAASAQNADICQCRHDHINAETGKRRSCGRDIRDEPVSWATLEDDGNYLARHANIVWDRLYRREWLLANPMSFDETSGVSSLLFAYQTLFRAGRLLVLAGRWLLRQDGSASSPKENSDPGDYVCQGLSPEQLWHAAGRWDPSVKCALLPILLSSYTLSLGLRVRHPIASLKESIRLVRREGVSAVSSKLLNRKSAAKAASSAPMPHKQVIWAYPPKVVVALASSADRLVQAQRTVDSLMSQSLQPDNVVIWLRDDVTNGDATADLARIDSVIIRRLDDTGPGAWIAATIREFPDAIIVTAADTCCYPDNWLQLLRDSFMYETTPFVHCHRLVRSVCPDGGWHLLETRPTTCYPFPTYLNQPDVSAGVLIPPVAVNPSVVAAALGHSTSDDEWLWLMSVLGKVQTKVVDNNIAGSGDLEALGSFDARSLLGSLDVIGYPAIEQTLRVEYKMMQQLDAASRIPFGQKIPSYYRKANLLQLQADLLLWYRRKTGMFMNLDNPKTLNEKIQWLKLFNSSDIRTLLSDKYLVRDWVAERIGAQYLIPLLGVWDRFDDIDFSALPRQFALKTNHGSHWNAIVYDKSELNIPDARINFNQWMASNYGLTWSIQLQYRGIKPKIIAEKLIAGFEIQDFKFFCFDGEVKFIWTDVGRATDHRRMMFDCDWQPLPCRIAFGLPNSTPARPRELNCMIELAQRLSQGFAHVRVDLYDVNGKVYFGEMAFTCGNGCEDTSPIEYAYRFGDYISLPAATPFNCTVPLP